MRRAVSGGGLRSSAAQRARNIPRPSPLGLAHLLPDFARPFFFARDIFASLGPHNHRGIVCELCTDDSKGPHERSDL